jgi:hypothetical protein
MFFTLRMEQNKRPLNYWQFFVIILLIGGISFFILTKNAGDGLSNNIKNLNNQVAGNTSVVTKESVKARPEFIDKADILLSKPGEVTWDDVLAVSPEEQLVLYSSLSQEKKDQLVKTWNEIKKNTNGDRTKIDEFIKNKSTTSVQP